MPGGCVSEEGGRRLRGVTDVVDLTGASRTDQGTMVMATYRSRTGRRVVDPDGERERPGGRRRAEHASGGCLYG